MSRSASCANPACGQPIPSAGAQGGRRLYCGIECREIASRQRQRERTEAAERARARWQEERRLRTIEFDHVPSRDEVLGSLDLRLRLVYLWLEERATEDLSRYGFGELTGRVRSQEYLAPELADAVDDLEEIHVSWPIDRASVPGRLRKGRPRTERFLRTCRLASSCAFMRGKKDGFGLLRLEELTMSFSIFRPWLASGCWED